MSLGIRWREDATWKARFDNSGPGSKGKRATIWHFEGYERLDEHPYHWEVKHGYNTIKQGTCTSLEDARSAVESVVIEQGWLDAKPIYK